MSERLDMEGRDLLAVWILSLVVLDGLALLVGADLSVVGFLGLAVTVAVLGVAAWDRRNGAEETGGDRNRQQTPTKHN